MKIEIETTQFGIFVNYIDTDNQKTCTNTYTNVFRIIMINFLSNTFETKTKNKQKKIFSLTDIDYYKYQFQINILLYI